MNDDSVRAMQEWLAKRNCPPKILVAEDDPADAGLFMKALQENGLDAIVAQDGEAAVQLASVNDFDIAFVDLFLPKISGHEVLRTLRKLKPNMRMVAMTGLTRPEAYDTIQRMCLDFGATTLLLKPVRSDAIRNLLGDFRLSK